MKILVFEGVEKTGKTSVSNWFNENYNFPVIRVFNKHKPDTSLYGLQIILENYGYKINDFIEDIQTLQILSDMKDVPGCVILDRSFVSADIYRAMEFGMGVPSQVFQWWLNKIKELDLVHIFFDQEFSNLELRGFFDKSRYEYLSSKFNDYYGLMVNKNCNVYRIDGKEKSVEIMALEIMKMVGINNGK